MPRKPSNPIVQCEYFAWKLFQRDGVFYADGRGGEYDLGKHSLGTRNRDEALENLRCLDYEMALRHNRAQPSTTPPILQTSIADGWQLYLEFCERPAVMKGVCANTLKRYRAVRDKHTKFCSRRGIQTWSDFDNGMLERYGVWLDKKYAYRTMYFELTLLKSVNRWLIKNGRLSAERSLEYQLSKAVGTDTYCYGREEVATMVNHCLDRPTLIWLANVIIGLAHTGMRIGELAALRWTDVDMKAQLIRVADERYRGRKPDTAKSRTTKGRRSRTIPLHPRLCKLLVAMERQADGRVFHAPQGGPLRPNNVLHVFVRDVIEPLSETFPTPPDGIGFEHGRLHSFRHFFCSQAFLGGASEGEIKEWLGHADSRMVEHYRHLRNEDARRKMEQIDFLDEDEDDQSSDVA